MKTKSKNKQGISLIVLVITIIVMIILAAAIILSLSSNGIIDRANEAVDKTDEAQVKAYAQTLWADAFLDGKRGSELIETVETELEKLGVTPMNYTLDISDSGMDIQKFDAANWEFAYTYDQETSTWSSKIRATDNSKPEGDIVVKFYNLGKEITPPSFEFNGVPFVFNPGNAYKMIIQGTGDMGAVMTTDGVNTITGVSAWHIDTAAFMQGAETCIIPYVTESIIDEGVTNIGAYAFGAGSSLKKVTVANSVRTIDECAFTYAKSLKSITLPNNVTSIGTAAFSSCSSLESIVIPSNVKSIGPSAFNGCSSLTSVTIPNSVTSIGVWSFNGCSSLTSVTIPNSVTSIGYAAFVGCASLESIIIPNSVTSIEQLAFKGCSSLTSVTIPNSVTSIGSGAFQNCSSLANITIPNSVTSIDNCTFYACTSLRTVTIPKSVTNIESAAFGHCNKLEIVNYTGSREEWENISIDSRGVSSDGWEFAYNTPLVNATKVYNYTPNN